MKVKNTALRLAGAAMMAVALAPWVGGAAAQAAVTVHLDKKWIGTSSTDANLVHDDCSYEELTATHTGTGWHFVLPSGGGLTTFTAYFQSAGALTVTTTETATGVIVQGGMGAVIYTPTDDTLVAGASTYPGDGLAADAGNNNMQLSHICTGSTPTPTPTPSTSTSVATTPATVTTTPAASVLPTKASASPAVSVKGTKAGTVKAVLPHTGSGVPVGLLLATSLALLLGGGALMMLPGLAPARGKRRRH
jgi:hypothetical protein